MFVSGENKGVLDMVNPIAYNAVIAVVIAPPTHTTHTHTHTHTHVHVHRGGLLHPVNCSSGVVTLQRM